MHWLDTTILVLLVVGATFGAMSGLLMQVARVVGLSVAVYAAIYLNEWATQALEEAVYRTPTRVLAEPWRTFWCSSRCIWRSTWARCC